MSADTHWLSRITPRSDIGHRQLVDLGSLDLYGQHQALWKLFDVAREERTERAEFLFRIEQKNSLPVFYVLSRQKPQDHAGLWHVEPKSYRPDIRTGDRLAFKLRVNPTVARPGENGGNSKRHDVVMDAKKRMGWKDLADDARPTLAHLAYEAGACWLRDRAERLGFVIDDQGLQVDGYRTWRSRGRKNIELSTLNFEGSLVVNDQARFLEALMLGIGRAKGFGCGLLLVRRL
ncbi:MAG: type I-E CRISPR-associated protein Cas6/Cse3/CasE [Sulfuricaulis sp.]|uniref:type I-E CRISPR-associated protein Cas6/Cse3/CasE n=1 Tax=Sulfuricaulis sp. TaxID=2003553 RepID=UPI0034A4B9A9